MTRAKDISKILTDADISGNIDVDGVTNLDVVDIDGTLNVQGETTLQTHLNMGDGDIIKLGASADLQIQHNGSGSYVSDSGTGYLFLQGAAQIRLQNPSGANYAIFADGGASTLYHNNAAKIATASTGVNVTGAITASSGNVTITDGNLVVAAGHGIDFSAQTATSVTGASATAELLDHYETGTWTPVVAGLTLATTQGHYTRIGNMVYYGVKLTMPVTTATTHMKITGVPFNNITDTYGGSLIYTNSAIIDSMIITTVGNGGEIQFYRASAAFATYANYNGALVRVSGAYRTDAA